MGFISTSLVCYKVKVGTIKVQIYGDGFEMYTRVYHIYKILGCAKYVIMYENIFRQSSINLVHRNDRRSDCFLTLGKLKLFHLISIGKHEICKNIFNVSSIQIRRSLRSVHGY